MNSSLAAIHQNESDSYYDSNEGGSVHESDYDGDSTNRYKERSPNSKRILNNYSKYKMDKLVVKKNNQNQKKDGLKYLNKSKTSDEESLAQKLKAV